MFFQGVQDPIWLYGASSLAPAHLVELRRLFADVPDERFPAPEDWVNLTLATTETAARIHEVQLCVPRQLPFMDRVATEVLAVRQFGQADEEVVYRDQFAFETAQGGDNADCLTFNMDTNNPPDDQVAVIVRGLAPGYSAAPQGFFISDIHGDLDEGENRLDEDGHGDDGDGDNDDDENCLQHVPKPEAAPNQELSLCTSTAELYGTAPFGNSDVGLYGASCPGTPPSVNLLGFGVRPDSSVAGYYVGVCGNPGSCHTREVKRGDQVLPPSRPLSDLGIVSDTNRYTVSVFAHDGCGNLSDSLAVQFDYIGEGCNQNQDGSACGTICGNCNNSDLCDFSCGDPNCGECRIDPPLGDRMQPGTCW